MDVCPAIETRRVIMAQPLKSDEIMEILKVLLNGDDNYKLSYDEQRLKNIVDNSFELYVSGEEKSGSRDMRDNLTGLYNRKYFNITLEKVQQEDIINFGFVMADLNGLSLINNTFGHVKGDDMIIEAAELLKSVCSDKCEIIRMGGGEFAIFLRDCKQEELDNICNSIKSECAKTSDRIIPLSISSGTSLRKDTNHSIRVLYRQAEGSMYSNKSLDTRSIHNQVMVSLTETLIARNVETIEHMKRVQELADGLGKKMGLSTADMDKLRLLALMHDIGEIAIPDTIIQKPAGLDDDEWMVMRTHCEVGCRIAMTSNELSLIANEICCHHERWDGKGYPYGYKEEQIPLLSRIISVVDTYDALTHHKIYKDAVSEEHAVSELKKASGTQLDPHIVKVFLEQVLQ